MNRHIAATLIFVLCLSFWVSSSLASTRVALVIGNGNYASAPLKNPPNDARDMTATLKKLGFDVIARTDADKREMIGAVNDFADKLRHSEIGLFYYAGHGMQIRNRNYLIPVSVNVASETDVEFEAVDAGRVIGKMHQAGNKLNVVVLDACRNNPFKRSFRTAEQGLARMDAPIGTIIAYATSQGSVAADGDGRNGVFTKHLLQAFKTPGLHIQDVFNEAGMKVMAETDSQQVPWTSNTPIPRYYLAGGSMVVEQEPSSSTASSAATKGSLRVTSTPAGAELFVDGRKVGTTPQTLKSLAAGTKTIRVKHQGYTPEEKRVRIRAGGKSRVSFVLSPISNKGWLTVTPEPADARVRILNIVPRYRKGMELDAGRYEIEVSAKGYQEKTRWVNLAAEEYLDIDIVLEQKTVVDRSSSLTDLVTGMEFVYVPGGCFQMGDTFGDGSDHEQPVHEVCVDGFYMGKYEVTQGEYEAITGSNPSRFTRGDNYPVETVSWDDAQEFIGKLNSRSGTKYRLPTEAEWEYAARSGGKRQKYSGGNTVDDVAWYTSNSSGRTHRVGTKAANDLGIHDMSGNVWEWCQDRYDSNYYSDSPRNNPQGPSSGSSRVNRGGSWSYLPRDVRSANRFRNGPGSANFGLGFRLVLVEGSR